MITVWWFLHCPIGCVPPNYAVFDKEELPAFLILSFTELLAQLAAT